MVTVLAVEHVGLGNSSHLLDLGDGRAAVMDPQRDVRPYLTIVHRRGLRIGYAVETHVHADFVTGSRELAAQGAEIVASAPPGSGSGTAAWATVTASMSVAWSWRWWPPRATPHTMRRGCCGTVRSRRGCSRAGR